MSSPEKEQWKKVNEELKRGRANQILDTVQKAQSPQEFPLEENEKPIEQTEVLRGKNFYGLFLLIGIVVLVIILLIFNGFFSKKDETVITLTYQQETLTNNQEFMEKVTKVLEEEAAKEKQKSFNQSIFLGDSLTEGLGLYGYVKVSNVFAQKGLSIERSMTKIKKIAKKNPKNIFIMLGINDLNYSAYSLDDIEANYQKLVKNLHKKIPKAHIYVESLLPVTAKYEKSNKRITNERIDKLNKRLKSLEDKYDYVTYVNISKLYKNKKGKLSNKISSDGYHLVADAYDIWIECVRKEIKN